MVVHGLLGRPRSEHEVAAELAREAKSWCQEGRV